MDAARAASGPAKPPGIDELILPGISPSNVKSGGRFRVEGVTNDMFNIARRLRELNDRLSISVVEDRHNKITFYAIMENTPTGEQLVFKCTRLDARVIEHVRYLLRVPFAQRFKEAEKRAAQYEASFQDDEMEKLVEKIGLPMLRELRECGFLGEYGSGPGSDLRRSSRAFGRG